MRLSKDNKRIYILNDNDVSYLNSLQTVSLFPMELKAPTLNPKVSIVDRKETGGKGAAAAQPIQKGEVICNNDSSKINKPIKYSWQIGHNVHLIGPGALDHNCERPTCRIDEDNRFIALRDIGVGESLTFNYLTTEYNMSVPFKCLCGEKSCFEIIRGFKYLSKDEQLYIIEKFGVSSYIKRLLNV